MGKKAIVVEHDPVTSRHLELCLRRLGYHDVRTASSSAVALDMAGTQVPHLVLIDIEIDGLDGVDTALALRRQFNVPCIFLTNRVDEITEGRAKRAAPLGYLLKPIKFEDLRSTMTVGMQKERLDRESKERELQTLQGSGPQIRCLRAEIALQATHDEATGLLNFRGLSLVGEHQLRLMRRLRSAVSVLRVQLLNVASIEKEFGAAAALQASKDLADILLSLQGEGDLCARLDAAHFVLLAPGENSAELSQHTSAAIDRHNLTAARAWKLAVRCTAAHSGARHESTIYELLHQTTTRELDVALDDHASATRGFTERRIGRGITNDQ